MQSFAELGRAGTIFVDSLAGSRHFSHSYTWSLCQLPAVTRGEPEDLRVSLVLSNAL